MRVECHRFESIFWPFDGFNVGWKSGMLQLSPS